MKNILLPTDFSENSWNAIEYAINFFKDTACNFYLLHVNKFSKIVLNDSPYVASQGVIDEVYVKPSKVQLRRLINRISTTFLHNSKHRFYTLSDYNFFIESIRKHVDEKNIDLIVMGTKGTSGLQKVIIGSNTSDVITKVKCSTLIVPEGAKFGALTEIAFPTDFSLTYDIRILQPISEILEHTSASLGILHISKKGIDLNSEQIKNKELLEDYFGSNKHSFHYLTNKKVEVAVQCFVESRHVNMICMVAKNLNYFQHILFHSKVEEISYHVKVPFLVLHE